jgi:hypothetical protein
MSIKSEDDGRITVENVNHPSYTSRVDVHMVRAMRKVLEKSAA